MAWVEVHPAGDATKGWEGICVSKNGRCIVAPIRNGRIWYSEDQGTTWAEIRPKGNADGVWFGSAMSSDGSVIYMGTLTNKEVYVSKDNGDTWSDITPSTASGDYVTIRCSSDGSKVLATGQTQRVWYSTDYGENWSEKRPIDNANYTWMGAGMSDDGTKFYVSASNTNTYFTADSGANWTQRSYATTSNANHTGGMTSDGVGAITSGNRIWTTTNSGANWTERRPNGDANFDWRVSKISADGTKMLAGYYTGPQKVYISTNSGANWTEQTPPNGYTFADLYAGDMDANGYTYVVAGYVGRMFVLASEIPPDDEEADLPKVSLTITKYAPTATLTTLKLSGNVKLSGDNIEGAIVRCINTTDESYEGDTVTDASGNYEFDGLLLSKKYAIYVEYEDVEEQKYNSKVAWDLVPSR